MKQMNTRDDKNTIKASSIIEKQDNTVEHHRWKDDMKP